MVFAILTAAVSAEPETMELILRYRVKISMIIVSDIVDSHLSRDTAPLKALLPVAASATEAAIKAYMSGNIMYTAMLVSTVKNRAAASYLIAAEVISPEAAAAAAAQQEHVGKVLNLK